MESSIFGAEFYDMKTVVELIEALRFKLCMFGFSIHGLTSVFCDNEAACKNTRLNESTLNKKHHSIDYHMHREDVVAQNMQVEKECTLSNLVDLFTKVITSVRRNFLLVKFTY